MPIVLLASLLGFVVGTFAGSIDQSKKDKTPIVTTAKLDTVYDVADLTAPIK